MHTTKLDYKTTGYFTDIINDYLAGDPSLAAYYNLPFELESFEKLIKKRSFPSTLRNALADAINTQYQQAGIDLKDFKKVGDNIDKLRNENTYTVTTGHQLCLFTGPLYFVYKIFSTINLCEALSKKYPSYNFVPVYWMATEDHDFAEVNHFHAFGKRFDWNTTEKGATGKIKTASLKDLLPEIVQVFGDREEGKELSALFEKAYLGSDNLAGATLLLVNEIFGKYGLVCLDPDVPALKAAFRPVMQADLTTHKPFALVNETNAGLGEKYKIQVNPREINLFYLRPGSRERIIRNEDSGKYELADSGKEFGKDELLELLDKYPERFSPNVILRPVYQEMILPNLAYIGGGAEIAYWLQLKAVFDHFGITFPVLVLRNSALWIDKTSFGKLKKNNITAIDEIFLPVKELLGLYAQRASAVDLDLDAERRSIDDTFEILESKVKSVDNGLVSYVKAERQKAMNMLNDLSTRMTRAEKKNHETGVKQLEATKERLFPNGSLQERHDNFAALYLMYGKSFFDVLKEKLDPLEKKFMVFSGENL